MFKLGLSNGVVLSNLQLMLQYIFMKTLFYWKNNINKSV